jgi:hypothetical protein
MTWLVSDRDCEHVQVRCTFTIPFNVCGTTLAVLEFVMPEVTIVFLAMTMLPCRYAVTVCDHVTSTPSGRHDSQDYISDFDRG